MKQSFERILKEQLENYEMPYDNGAWEQFSKRLDGTPSTPFYRKWWFAAAVGTVLVGSATYFARSSNDTKPSDNVAAVETTTPSTTAAQQTASAQSGSRHTSKTQAAAQGTVQQKAQQTAAYTWDPGTGVSQANRTIHIPASPLTIITDRNEISTSLIASGPNVSSGGYTRFEVPSSICLNETVTIKNPNDAAITVSLPNGKTKVIQGNQTADIKASEAGTITVQSGNQSETITVNEAAASNLIIDVDPTLLYEKGIPTLKFNVLNADRSVTWASNVNQNAQSVAKNELTVHPFTQREVYVTAHSTDQNGCPVEESKTIILEQTYNLLAPNGFNPESYDERNKTFIPFALTLRDTPFEMVIMDAKTMTTVYRTTDASQGWDGTDSRTGQIAAPGSTWLWKVILKAPQPGEKNEYTGVVTRRGQ